jgi:hypothetical protein
MKRLLPMLGILVALLLAAPPAFAAENHACDHDGTTIQSLHDCVVHAYEMGHITSRGPEISLLAKVDAAQVAVDRGQPIAAVKLLRVFSYEVNAWAGKGIHTDHAGHLVDHARNVIKTLGG